MAWHTLCASALAWALIGVAWDPQPMPIDAEAIAVPPLVELTERTERRCPNCGSIESKRALPRLASDPRALLSYEYSVRMGDGSSHLFREQMPVSWRLGERLILIEGAGSLD
jgi:hypothetical protein